jgi:drug/metabolite transporter (DMT)-like permease
MVVWGSSFTVTKLGVAHIPPFAFAFLRFVVASLFLLPLFVRHRKKYPEKHAIAIPWRTILVMALMGVMLFYVFFNVSLLNTSASQGALIEGFLPVCIALLAAIFLKEKLGRVQVAGILLSVAGVAMIGFLADEELSHAPNPLKGNFYMLLAMVAWAVYTILSKKITHIDPLIVTSWVSFIGTLFLLPVACWENRHTGLPPISAGGWVAIIYLGAVASALCYFLYSKALETLPASQVGNFINLDPVIGLIIALLFLPEHINVLQIAGGILVLLGIWMSTKHAAASS